VGGEKPKCRGGKVKWGSRKSGGLLARKEKKEGRENRVKTGTKKKGERGALPSFSYSII